MFNTNSLIFILVYTILIVVITYIATQYILKRRKNNKPKIEEVVKNDNTTPFIGTSNAVDDPKEEESTNQSVAILETDENLLKLLNDHLNDDYLLYSFSTINTFLDYLATEIPSIIVLDAPTCASANEIVDHIKQNIEISHIPIIRLISKQSQRVNCKKFADLYIEKPFSVYELKKGIEGLLMYSNTPCSGNKNKEIEINSDCLHCSNNIDWRFINEVKQIVDENMQDSDFNIDVLCSLLNMSRTSFYNKIKALTGEAPADYVRSLKLQKAADLLSEDKLNINEIAEATGFSDAKYFREVFKKHYNMNPTKYKKEINL